MAALRGRHGFSSMLAVKPLPRRLGRRRVHQLTDGGDRLVMDLELAFEFVELPSQGGVRGEQLAQLHEGAHDLDAHGGGAQGIEDVGGLDRPVFGEGVGAVLDVLGAPTLQGRNLVCVGKSAYCRDCRA